MTLSAQLAAVLTPEELHRSIRAGMETWCRANALLASILGRSMDARDEMQREVLMPLVNQILTAHEQQIQSLTQERDRANGLRRLRERHIEILEQERDALRAQPQWQPISEAPDWPLSEGYLTPALLFAPDLGIQLGRCGKRGGDIFAVIPHISCGHLPNCVGATHFMPLPTPPKGASR